MEFLLGDAIQTHAQKVRDDDMSQPNSTTRKDQDQQSIFLVYWYEVIKNKVDQVMILRVIFDQNNKEAMETISLLIVLAVAVLGSAGQDYTLTLDWSLSPPSSNSQVGYVTWNEQTVITLASLPSAPKEHHQIVTVTFKEGPNQLGIYFIGLSGTLNIDNVSLTKDGSVINYILNGDFEMCQLGSNQQSRTFSGKIPGWNAPQILIKRTGDRGVQLALNTQTRSITQTISFGMVSKYQFIDEINIAIQNQAKDIINANIQSINTNLTGSIWSTPVPPTNRTFSSATPTPTIYTPNPTPINISAPAPPILQVPQGQVLSNQVSQFLQLRNVPSNLIH